MSCPKGINPICPICQKSGDGMFRPSILFDFWRGLDAFRVRFAEVKTSLQSSLFYPMTGSMGRTVDSPAFTCHKLERHPCRA